MALVTAAQFDITPNIVGALGSGQQLRANEQAMDIQRQQADAEAQKAAILAEQTAQSNALARAALGLGSMGQTPTATTASGGQVGVGGQPVMSQQQAFDMLIATDPERAKQQSQAIKAGFDNQNAREQQRIGSVVRGAAEALASSDPLSTLKRRRETLDDTRDTDEVIALYESGQGEAAEALLNKVVQMGEQLEIIKPKGFAQEELDLKRMTLDIRREESRQRALDRELGRETNAIQREQLQQKLESSRRESEQTKRDLEFEAEGAVASVKDSMDTVDRLLEGNALEQAAGVNATFPTLPGTPASDFEATMETLQSQAFLSQVQKMKGMGALSENEGKKLGAAIGSLDIKMSDDALRKELGRIKDTLGRAKSKLEKKFNIPAQEDTTQNKTQVGRFTVEVE
jgi:hypothetical protein